MDEFEALEQELADANQPQEEQEVSLEEAETNADLGSDDGGSEPPPLPDPEPAPVSELPKEEELPPVEVKTHTVPNDPRFGDHAGKKMTAAELEDTGLLEKFVTWEHQEIHSAKLYQELKKETDDLKARFADQIKEAEAQQVAASVTPEQISRNADETQHVYYPHLVALAKQGAFEEDFLVSYPKVATQLEQRFDAGTGALMAMNKRLNELESSVGKRETVVRRTESQSAVFDSIDQVVSKDEGTYGVLADEKVRSDFIGWIVDPSNPLPFKHMNVTDMKPAVIEAAFLNYIKAKPEVLAPAVPAVPAAVPVPQVIGTTGTKVPQILNEFEALEAELESAERSKFGL